MGASRKFYTDQFKEEAVKLAESVGIAQAARPWHQRHKHQQVAERGPKCHYQDWNTNRTFSCREGKLKA